MERRWYSSYDPGTPRVFKPEKSLPDYFKDNVIAAPNRVALSFYGYDVTYKELDEAIDRFAAGLVKIGVKKGDRVALFLPNCPQFVISAFGALRAGAIYVPMNPMFKQAELEYELNDCGAETLVVLDYLFPEIKKIQDRIKLKNKIVTSLWDYMPEEPVLPLPGEMNQEKVSFPEGIDFLELLGRSLPLNASRITDLKEDIALLQYTGGTTGLPKGAIGTHYTLAHNVVGATKWFRYTADDVHVASLPFFHVMGSIQIMGAALASGGRLVILTRFSPETMAKAVEHYRITVWVTATTMIIAMLEWPGIDKYDLSSLRICWYGGQPMPGEVLARLRQLLPDTILGEGYGLSETFSAGGAISPLHGAKPGYMGVPNISTDIRIVDLETGTKEVSPGEEGEITTRGPGQMTGYWNNPVATRETLRDGWLYTGDIGMMDEDGYVVMVGRRKELIKCSGYSVFPTEVEELLHRHPAVMEVAVIGIPDYYRGETIKAFIVLRPKYRGKCQEEEIIAWAKENMATYKRPRLVEFREELPKTSFGKILRRVLKEEEEGKLQRR